MKVLWTQFPNGPFGDPALYLWDGKERHGVLFDCGDLSRFSTRMLLKVTHIFLSHCHMDHFFGFDLLLRVHMGRDKTVTIFGPPETSKHVEGKLQGYLWNLAHFQCLAFQVVDLNTSTGEKTTTFFRATDQFKASNISTENFDPSAPLYETKSFTVSTVMLDHQTPSMAYSIVQKPNFVIDLDAIRELGLKPGNWIDEVKKIALSPERENNELAKRVFVLGRSYKIAYATDGAASEENREVLIKLVEGADLFYSETCFIKADQQVAHQTKHFTTEFIAELARDAHVKKIAPFHFSKRYLDHPERVLEEVGKLFHGGVISIKQEEVKARF